MGIRGWRLGLFISILLLVLMSPFLHKCTELRFLSTYDSSSVEDYGLIISSPVNKDVTLKSAGEGEIFFYKVNFNNSDDEIPTYKITRPGKLLGLYLMETDDNNKDAINDFFASFQATNSQLQNSIELISGKDGQTLRSWSLPMDIQSFTRVIAAVDLDNDKITDFFGLSNGKIYRGSSEGSKIAQEAISNFEGSIKDIIPAKDLNDDGVEEVYAIKQTVNDKKETIESIYLMDLRNQTVLGSADLPPNSFMPGDLSTGDVGDFNKNKIPDFAVDFYQKNNDSIELHEVVIGGQRILKGDINFIFERIVDTKSVFKHAAYKMCDLDNNGNFELIVLEYGNTETIHLLVYENDGRLRTEKIVDPGSHYKYDEFNLFDCPMSKNGRHKNIIMSDPNYVDASRGRYGRVSIIDSRSLKTLKNYYGTNPKELFGKDVFILRKTYH